MGEVSNYQEEARKSRSKTNKGGGVSTALQLVAEPFQRAGKGAIQAVSISGNEAAKIVSKTGNGAVKAVSKSIGSVPIIQRRRQMKREEELLLVDDDMEVPDIPPDTKLQNMNVIIRSKLKDISVKDYYENVWSEGNRCDKEPFFGPMLEATGTRFDINVEDWTFAEGDDQEFKSYWCGEHYSQKRVVTYKFERQTHLYIGPPIANASDTQHCRWEGDDRLVVSTTLSTEGVPYGSCFLTEIRWVASRAGTNDLLIECGLFVNFVKSNILAGKIRSAVMVEVTEALIDQFETVKRVCHAEAEEVPIEEGAYEPEPVGTKAPSSQLGQIFFALLGGGQHGVLSNRQYWLFLGLLLCLYSHYYYVCASKA